MYVLIGIELIFFGFGLCLLQALQNIIESRKLLHPLVLFFLFNSIIFLEIGLIARGIPLQYPGVLFLFFTSIVLIGPLNLLYYHTLLYSDQELSYRNYIHFIPSIIVFCIEVLFQLQPTHFKINFINEFFTNPLSHIMFIPLVLSVLHVLGYILYVLKVVFIDLGFREYKKKYRFIGIMTVLVLLVITMLWGGFVFSLPKLFIAGGIVNLIIHICLFLGIRLYPEYFESFKKEIRKKRYEKSMLKGVDTEAIQNRLKELMSDEELYRDSEISLASMAEKLSISQHQLSQLLNERIGSGFHDFVNLYRIKEAQELLRINSDANIISVCFKVGFNSKSSFNTAFKKITGMTPSDFKNQNEE